MSEDRIEVDGFVWVVGPSDGQDAWCRVGHARRKPWNRDGIRWRVTEKRSGWVWVMRDPVATIPDGPRWSPRMYKTPLNAMRAYAKAVQP